MVEYDENELAEAAHMHDLAHGAYIDLWREGGTLSKLTAYAAWMDAGRRFHRIANGR